jgi:hypothetical protein
MAKRSMRSSPRLFISYRRDDTGGDAGRLNDTLNQLLGFVAEAPCSETSVLLASIT